MLCQHVIGVESYKLIHAGNIEVYNSSFFKQN